MDAYKLTKIDLAALRQCDSIVVHFKGAGESSVKAIKRARTSERDPFAADQHHTIAAPVNCRHVYGVPAHTHAEAFGHISVYHGQTTPVGSILAVLRVGDQIGFEFYPEAHSNGYLIDAGLYGDVLNLHVTRGKQRLVFEIDHCNSPNNSARMVRGVADAPERKRRLERAG